MVNKGYPRETVDRRAFLRAAGSLALTLPFAGCGRSEYDLSGSAVVIGAGLSGLAAAMLLEERGLDVTVVEARNRLGGRVVTMDDVPGNPEGGGPVISDGYERLVRIAGAVGAEFGPMSGYEAETLLHVNGQNVTADAWGGSAANKLAGPMRQMPPGYLLGALTMPDNPLTDHSDWIDGRHAGLDVSLADYLAGNGADAETLRLINVSPNTNDIETTSALWALRNAQRRRDSKGGKLITPVGGNSQIIDGMAAAIKGTIHTGKPVVEIRSLDDRVAVSCDDGTVIEAEFAVITLPFSVLRDVRIEPALSGLQKEAVEELPYTAITKYFLVPKHAFWEEDGLPVNMWTDTRIERIFPNRDANGGVASLTVWIDGTNAQAFDAMPEEEQVATVLDDLARIRPATKGALEPVGTISWARDPWARGAYAHYAPGQITRLKPVMAEPWHRLHFAGEHTAITSPGLESAIESAQRATKEIVSRLV